MPTEELKAMPVDEVVARVGVAEAIQIKSVASLLFTYRCTIACAHCLFSCSPDRPDRCTSLEDGLKFLRQLRATDRVIHIAGGEAIMYYDRMMEICRAAYAEGVGPHFIESNASWCASDDLARRRYEELRAVGVVGMLFSADPHHQRFVSPARRERAYRIAEEVFGRENLIAENLSVEKLAEFRAMNEDEARLGDFTRRYAPLLVGRAAGELGRFFPDRPLEELAGDELWHPRSRRQAACSSELDPATMWEIHIDPYGNIQTCCGIVLGNAHETPLPNLMARGFHTDNALVRVAYERGPYGLLEMAEERGYRRRDGYKQKCHLCWEVRKFLRPYFPETFGPAEVYEQEKTD